MASKRIDVTVNTKSAGQGLKAAGKDIGTLKKEAGTAGQTIGQSISKGTTVASNSLNKLKTVSNNTFSAIKKGAGDAANSLDGMNGAIGSVIAGFGALELAQMAWSGSTSRQFNQAYLATKVGQKSAAQYMKTIQDIVVQVPGDDTFMNQLLSGAVARQTNLGNKELSTLGRTAADYMVVSQNMGKSMIETQMDLKEYIQTGNTSQLERDSILKNQMKTLKGQETVEDRIKALQKAMNDEGYAGLSNLDIASIKWEEIKGRIALAATNVGEKLLPYIEKVLDFIIDLDEKTNGFSTTVGFVGAAFIAMALPVAYVAKKMYDGYKWAARMTGELVKSAGASKAVSSPGGNAGKTSGSNFATGFGVALAVAIPLLTVEAFDIARPTVAAEAKKLGLTATEGYLSSRSAWSMAGDILGQMFGQGQSKAVKKSQDESDVYARNARQRNLGETGTLIGMLKGYWGDFARYVSGAWSNTMAWIGSGARQAAAGAIGAWNSIRGGAIRAFSSISGAWGRLKSYISKGISGAIRIATGALTSAWNRVRDFYNYVRNGATGVVNWITGKGPAGPGIGAARGPYDGMNLNYENYAGAKKSPFTCNGMSGNCVDMSMGLMAMNNGRGRIVSGTWNGGPHVWYQDPAGKNWDPARKALNGTWNPPARGPGDNMGAIIINGDVYGFDDFQKKVEKATNRIVMGAI